MRRPASITEWLDTLSPPKARVLARDRSSRGQPLTLFQIAQKGGLSFNKARLISKQRSWATVTVGDAAAFLKGCGITLQNWSLEKKYLKRTRKSQRPLAHLEALNLKERRHILENLRSGPL